MGILYYTKFESNPGYKAILGCVMSYFMTLMIIGPEFFEDPKNDQINP